MRLELGSGERPTPGFLSSDVYPHPDVDIVSPAWDIDLPDGSVSEVLALGVMEHLTYQQFTDTVANVHRMLEPAGLFLFDVPDLPVWCRYLIDLTEGREAPFTLEHVCSTLYGWQRWPGDEHKSGWTVGALLDELDGFTVKFGVEPFKVYERRRFWRPSDAHLYVSAVR